MSDIKEFIESRDRDFLSKTTQAFYMMSEVLEGIVRYLKVTDPSLVRWTHVDLYGDTIHIIGTIDDRPEIEMFSEDFEGDQKILNVKLPLDLVSNNEVQATIDYLTRIESEYQQSHSEKVEEQLEDMLTNLDKRVLH